MQPPCHLEGRRGHYLAMEFDPSLWGDPVLPVLPVEGLPLAHLAPWSHPPRTRTSGGWRASPAVGKGSPVSDNGPARRLSWDLRDKLTLLWPLVAGS